MAVQQLHTHITASFSAVSKWLETWKKYRPLWKVDKTVTLEKFMVKTPTLLMFDEKLAFYNKLAMDVSEHVATNDVEFIRITSTLLQKSIHNEGAPSDIF